MASSDAAGSRLVQKASFLAIGLVDDRGGQE